jgi:benzil reductase ((S)-benzoin forming)
MATHDTLIWISGATDGIGWGLARTVPTTTRASSTCRARQHPDLETIRFDLSQPETWDAVEESFKKELANFQGKRVIFIHNAFFRASPRFIGEGEPVNYREEIIGNGMAPQVLGDMFLRHVQPHYESGLVLMSSAAARSPFEGHAVYCAAKSGVEMWVRVVRRELKRRGKKDLGGRHPSGLCRHPDHPCRGTGSCRKLPHRPADGETAPKP